jgi:hypothetical protein
MSEPRPGQRLRSDEEVMDDALDAERALADDLEQALDDLVPGWEKQFPTLAARYREARGL